MTAIPGKFKTWFPKFLEAASTQPRFEDY